ncbi:MAG: hypothetical protein ACYS0D_07960 [Planctomycetota bacterium]
MVGHVVVDDPAEILDRPAVDLERLGHELDDVDLLVVLGNLVGRQEHGDLGLAHERIELGIVKEEVIGGLRHPATLGVERDRVEVADLAAAVHLLPHLDLPARAGQRDGAGLIERRCEGGRDPKTNDEGKSLSARHALHR